MFVLHLDSSDKLHGSKKHHLIIDRAATWWPCLKRKRKRLRPPRPSLRNPSSPTQEVPRGRKARLLTMVSRADLTPHVPTCPRSAEYPIRRRNFHRTMHVTVATCTGSDLAIMYMQTRWCLQLPDPPITQNIRCCCHSNIRCCVCHGAIHRFTANALAFGNAVPRCDPGGCLCLGHRLLCAVHTFEDRWNDYIPDAAARPGDAGTMILAGPPGDI